MNTSINHMYIYIHNEPSERCGHSMTRNDSSYLFLTGGISMNKADNNGTEGRLPAMCLFSWKIPPDMNLGKHWCAAHSFPD